MNTNENYISTMPKTIPKNTTIITWRCPDCKGVHTTPENRKYYCTLLCRTNDFFS